MFRAESLPWLKVKIASGLGEKTANSIESNGFEVSHFGLILNTEIERRSVRNVIWNGRFECGILRG